MSIRIASAEDTKVLARVHAASWYAAYHGILSDQVLNQFTVDEWESHFKSAMKLPATSIAVAERSGNVMGSAQAEIRI